MSDNFPKDDEAKLLTIIRDKDTVEKEPQKVIDAIDKLGEMNSVRAIDDLVRLLGVSDFLCKYDFRFSPYPPNR